jgi:hypothetical protein
MRTPRRDNKVTNRTRTLPEPQPRTPPRVGAGRPKNRHNPNAATRYEDISYAIRPCNPHNPTSSHMSLQNHNLREVDRISDTDLPRLVSRRKPFIYKLLRPGDRVIRTDVRRSEFRQNLFGEKVLRLGDRTTRTTPATRTLQGSPLRPRQRRSNSWRATANGPSVCRRSPSRRPGAGRSCFLSPLTGSAP